MTYDVAAHQRQKIRTLEGDNHALKQHRAKLERLIAHLLPLAARDDCDPLTLLAALDTTDELTQLLLEDSAA